jgi:DNA-binding response OmpR family regulator
MAQILVIEDEPHILAGLRDNLELDGYSVLTATSGEEGLEKAAASHPDLVILDIALPKTNGFDVCRQLRGAGSRTPVIMLTARSQEKDRVLGFELGADDYVIKPFSIVELLARVRAVLRRSGGNEAPSDVYRIGDVEIDLVRDQVHRAGRRVEFTTREFELLRYLVRRAGQVVTREELFHEVWGYDMGVTTRTIDNFVAKVRHKIEPSLPPRYILTVHGRGYKFVG